jgi:hypothetical protein
MEGDQVHALLTVLVDGCLSPTTRHKRNAAAAVRREKKQKRRREGFFRKGMRRTREDRWR